jgi:cellulose synthase (UDP-forming)
MSRSVRHVFTSLVPRPMLRSIRPASWSFLITSLLVFLLALLAANLDLSWLTPPRLNALSMRQLPEQFQIRDPWLEGLGPVVVAAVGLLLIRRLPRRPWAYALANGGLLFFSLRYYVWRSTTLNTAHPLSFLLSAVLFVLEGVYIVVLLMEFLPSLWFDPASRRLQADAQLAAVREEPYQVDIFITTYNESPRQVRRCVEACLAQSYGRRSIHVLDDGAREEVRQLAASLGVNYLSRETNQHRKAGNLNHALAHTSAPLIAIFDCDFVPYENFLDRTLGFFSQPDVAIVQTPQHYFQTDFHARSLAVDQLMPSDVSMFYHYQQVLRDRFNAVVCVGTSYVVRRAALEAIGGYVTTCIIEDHQTSTRLLSTGWRVVFLDEILSVGESPDRFRDYIDQRLRWLQGNFQIFFPASQLNVWTSLSGMQKLFYANLLISNFLPVARLWYLYIPIFSLMLGNQLIVAPPLEYIAYAVPFTLLLHGVPPWVSNYNIHHIWGEVYDTITTFMWTKRTIRILRHPFRILGSTITPKTASAREEKFLDVPLLMHLLVFLALLLLAFLVRYGLPVLNPSWNHYPVTQEGQEITVFWNLYNLLIVATALLACVELPSRRQSDRFPIELMCCVQVDGQTLWGVTRDLSEDGASLTVTTRFQQDPASTVRLEFVDHGLTLEADLLRASQVSPLLYELNLRFRDLSPQQETLLIKMIYSPQNPLLQKHRVGTLDSMGFFLGALFRGHAVTSRYRS